MAQENIRRGPSRQPGAPRTLTAAKATTRRGGANRAAGAHWRPLALPASANKQIYVIFGGTVPNSDIPLCSAA